MRSHRIAEAITREPSPGMVRRFEWWMLFSRVARWDRPDQIGIISAIFLMPEWLSHRDAFSEQLDFFVRSGSRIRGDERIRGIRQEILVVSVVTNGFENILELSHGSSLII